MTTRDGRTIWVRDTSLLIRDAAGQPLYIQGFMEDISERKQAELEIERLSNFNQSIIQSASEGISVQDSQGVFRMINPAGAEIFARRADEILGHHWKELIPVDQHAIVQQADAERQGGKSGRYELELQHPHGERRTVLVSGSPRYENGEFLGSMAVFSDITSLKQAQSEVIQRNRELAALNHAGRLLNRLASPDQILEIIYEAISLVLDSRNFYIALHDRESDTLSFPIYTIDGQRQPVRSRPFGNGLTEYILNTREPLLIARDVDGEIERLGVSAFGSRARSYLGVPIAAGERILGVIALQDYRAEHAYTAREMDLLTTLASQTSIALDNSRLYDAAKQEISERKLAEARIRQSEDRYRDLVENSQDLICTHDMQGMILSANPASARRLGYQQDELIGMNLRDIMAPEVRTHFPFYISRLKRRGSASGLLSVLTRDGQRRVWEYQNTVRTDGVAQPIVRGMARDITERKRAEDALKRSESDYRHLFDNANDVILIFDPHSEIILEANAAACAIYDFDRQELVGMSLKTLTRDVPRGELQVKQILEDGAYRDFETTHINRQGQEIHFLINSSVIEYRGRQAILSMNRDITERKRAEEKIQLQVRHLSALHEIDKAISASAHLPVILDVFLKQTVAQLEVDAAAILLFNPGMLMLEYAAGQGLAVDRRTHMRLDESYAGRAVLERNIVHIPNFMQTEMRPAQSQLLLNEGFVDYYAVPLFAKGQVKGVLEILHRAPIDLDLDWLDFLETLAGQAAIAIDNAQLFADLQRSNTNLVLAYDATIEGWSRAMDLRDKETEGHTLRVTRMTLDLARSMGVSEAELIQIRRGALLHDIGKLGIPDHILLKTDQLTDEEWEIMRRHPTYAYEMLSSITYLIPALDIPYCHHEKWDGTGYPRGLKGEQIPLEARIFAIVDVWDAVTSDRPYRPAWSREQTLGFIREQSGRHFDPQVVEAFLKMVAEGGSQEG